MTLGDKQKLFMHAIKGLIQHIHEQGYECTLGDGYRDPRVFGDIGETKGYGYKNSNHKRRLAIDINLFKDGKYLGDTEDHRPIGEYWESISPYARWGGRFNDGNHYSFEHEGHM
jgi:hypothetical protein